MEPVQIVSALRKHAPLALAHIILGAIIGLTIALLSPPVYSSQAKALVAAEGGDGTRSVSSASSVITTIMPTLVEIGTSQSVVDQVAASTGIERSKVAGAVTLSTPTSSLIIDVTARASSPQEAQVNALRDAVSEMSIQKEEVTLTLSDLDRASLPTSPSGPSRTRYALVGAVAGAILGVVTALLMSKLNPAAAQENARGVTDDTNDLGLAVVTDIGGVSGAAGVGRAGVVGPARAGRRASGAPPTMPLSYHPTGSGGSPSAPLT